MSIKLHEGMFSAGDLDSLIGKYLQNCMKIVKIKCLPEEHTTYENRMLYTNVSKNVILVRFYIILFYGRKNWG